MTATPKSSRRVLVLHPLLLVLYLLSELYFNVYKEVAFYETLRAFVIVTLFAGLLLVTIAYAIRNWHRAGLISSALLFLFLFYGIIYRILSKMHIGNYYLDHSVIFPLGIALVYLISTRWLWQKIKNPLTLTKFLNFTLALAIIFSFFNYVRKISSQRKADFDVLASAMTAQHDPTLQLSATGYPDIYYIILDGYGRADVLQEVYGFDNTEFIDFLKSRGFYVAEQSQSNYIQTALSLASTLNFVYLDTFPLAADVSDRSPMEYLISNSQVRSLLTNLGYRLVTMNNGYEFTFISDADIVLHPNQLSARMNVFEGLIAMGSAIIIPVDQGYVDLPEIGYQTKRTKINYAFDSLTEVPEISGPKLVFFHIVAPHPPFIFDQYGNPITPEIPDVGARDGNYFSGTLDQYLEGYPTQVQYVNRRMQEVVDAILKKSTSPPIIIIQGDHGPGAFLDWQSSERSCLRERIAILNAYYLPGLQIDTLYPEITPVNTFRLIFDAYFHTHLGLLEDHSYYSPWEYPFAYVEVGERSQILCPRP